MNEGPIEGYTYSPSGSKPGEKLGFSAVGPGWTPLLRTLDNFMRGAISHAVQHATVVREEYRDQECEADANIQILQIKEKFGNLRVYWRSNGLGSKIREQVSGAVSMAEAMSLLMCEECGSTEGTETRGKNGSRFSRTLTLCAKHHAERDSLTTQAFEFGNGDKI